MGTLLCHIVHRAAVTCDTQTMPSVLEASSRTPQIPHALPLCARVRRRANTTRFAIAHLQTLAKVQKTVDGVTKGVKAYSASRVLAHRSIVSAPWEHRSHHEAAAETCPETFVRLVFALDLVRVVLTVLVSSSSLQASWPFSSVSPRSRGSGSCGRGGRSLISYTRHLTFSELCRPPHPVLSSIHSGERSSMNCLDPAATLKPCQACHGAALLSTTF